MDIVPRNVSKCSKEQFPGNVLHELWCSNLGQGRLNGIAAFPEISDLSYGWDHETLSFKPRLAEVLVLVTVAMGGTFSTTLTILHTNITDRKKFWGINFGKDYSMITD